MTKVTLRLHGSVMIAALAAGCGSGVGAPMGSVADADVDVAPQSDILLAARDVIGARDGGAADGSAADGSEVDGSGADGSEADGSEADGSGADVDGQFDGGDGPFDGGDGAISDAEDAGPPTPVDTDKDGVVDALDCAPTDAKIHPGAAESCNGKDDDCDGKVDEGVKNKCGKCGAVPKETCNGKDDDCDGQVDEGVKNKCGKCGAVPKETCNGKDDDCDGQVDEGVKNKCGKCGAVPKEICNGKDDDCDGAKDEGGVCGGVPKVCYPGAANNYSVCLDLVAKSTVKVSGYNWSPHSSPQYQPPKNLLDLSTAPSSLAVAKNFILGEFMQASKGKYGVYSAKTVARWQSVRSALGVPLTVNSGFRSPGYNAGIAGSAKFSRHTYGDAADVTAKGKVSLSKIASTCKAKGAGYTQLYATHVHCDWRNDTLGHDFWPKKTGFGAGSPPPDRGDAPPGEGRDWQEQAAWAKVVGPSQLEPRVGHQLVLRAIWGPGFDEGIPWVQWQVHGPHRSWEIGPQVGLAITPQVAGHWRIDWRVGGNVEGSVAFEVLPRSDIRLSK